MLYTIILVFHVILAITLISLILIQKPEGGALGVLGGGDNMSFLSGKATGNFLTKTTGILAVLFIITSLSLAFLAKGQSDLSVMVDELDVLPTTVSGEDNNQGDNLLKAPPKPEKIEEHNYTPKAPISQE